MPSKMPSLNYQNPGKTKGAGYQWESKKKGGKKTYAGTNFTQLSLSAPSAMSSVSKGRKGYETNPRLVSPPPVNFQQRLSFRSFGRPHLRAGLISLRPRGPNGGKRICGPGGKHCTCCSTGVLVFSLVFSILLGSVLLGLFFPRIPSFEIDLTELENIGVTLIPITIQGDFSLELVNENIVGMEILDLQGFVTFDDIKIDVDMDKPAILPAKSSTPIQTRINIDELNFGNGFGAISTFLSQCSNEGDKIKVDLLADVIAKYLGITVALTLGPDAVVLNCPFTIGR